MSLLDFLNPQATPLDQMRSLNSAGTGLEAGGQLMSAFARFQYGSDQRQAADFQAQQMRQQASNALGSAQRQAWSVDQATRYIASNALAAAAASGGGASDPTVVSVMARTAAEGAYRKSVALYQGEDAARKLDLQAEATEYGGRLAQKQTDMAGAAGGFGAFTTLVKGQARDSSILQRFGGGGPTPTNPFGG